MFNPKKAAKGVVVGGVSGAAVGAAGAVAVNSLSIGVGAVAAEGGTATLTAVGIVSAPVVKCALVCGGAGAVIGGFLMGFAEGFKAGLMGEIKK